MLFDFLEMCNCWDETIFYNLEQRNWSTKLWSDLDKAFRSQYSKLSTFGHSRNTIIFFQNLLLECFQFNFLKFLCFLRFEGGAFLYMFRVNCFKNSTDSRWVLWEILKWFWHLSLEKSLGQSLKNSLKKTWKKSLKCMDDLLFKSFRRNSWSHLH